MVFFPGTKGFKDWGAWPQMYRIFNHAGIALVTVNFSHNGVVFPDMESFTDMEGYGQNTISLELQDIGICMDWVSAHAGEWNFDASAITLCGHSRAGAEVLIYAASDPRVAKVAAWAPVTDFAAPYALYDREKWEKDGYVLIPNTRTGQDLPVNVTFIQDLEKHKAKFDVPNVAATLEIPVLLIHGAEDQTVPISSSHLIHETCLHALMISIDRAGHTFGTSHPWDPNKSFPHEFQELLENTAEFILD